MGYAYALKGDWLKAEASCLQAIETAKIHELTDWEPYAYFTMAEVAWSFRKDEIAVHYYRKAAELYGKSDEIIMVGNGAYTAGMEAFLHNDLASAEKYFQTALKAYYKGGWYNDMASCLEALALCRIQDGRFEKTVLLHGAAASCRGWKISDLQASLIIRHKVETLLEPIRAGLGESRYAELLREGECVSVETAEAYAQRINPK